MKWLEYGQNGNEIFGKQYSSKVLLCCIDKEYKKK